MGRPPPQILGEPSPSRPKSPPVRIHIHIMHTHVYQSVHVLVYSRMHAV